jgi:hypothetical protein
VKEVNMKKYGYCIFLDAKENILGYMLSLEDYDIDFEDCKRVLCRGNYKGLRKAINRAGNDYKIYT